MKTVYKAQNLLVYQVSDEGEIQFRDTTQELGWKRSEFLTIKAQQLGLPAQEVLDKEARRQGWIAVKEAPQKDSAAPEEAAAEASVQSNTVQLAKDVLASVRHFKGEFTADGCRQTVGKSYTFCGDPVLGDFQCSPRGVKLAPRGEEFMDLTWAKFIKFCKENGLIEETPTAAAGTAPQSAPIASDAQSSPCPSSGADVPIEEGGDNLPADLPEVCRKCKCPTCAAREESCANQCWLNPERVSDCEYFGPEWEICDEYKPEKGTDVCKEIAPKPAAAATTDSPAVKPTAETLTTSENAADAASSNPELSFVGAPTNLSAPTSPADAEAATQSLSAAAPASLEAQPLDSSAFDFGADSETNAMLLQDAQIFMAGSMARVMAAKRAHDRTAHNYRGSWGKWCELVGISRDTGDNMVRVAEQFGNIQIDGQSLIDLQPMKLLYAASKPSTPPEARAKVESLEITSSKQFQELLAQLKAKEQELADERASREAERASTSALLADEQQRRQEANEARIAAEKAAQGAKESYSIAQKNETLVIRRAKEAEKQLADAQQRIAELEARPVEVVGVDPDEIQRRAEKLAEEKTQELRSDMAQLAQEHDAVVDALDAADQRRYALTLARVLDAVNACEDLLRRQFEGLRHADYDRVYVPATDMMENLCNKIAQAILDGEWPGEEAEK